MTATVDTPVEIQKPVKIRLSLDVTPEGKALLDEMAAREGITVAELLRRAIALLKAAKEAEYRGEAVALISEEGRVTARLIGF